MMTSNPWKTTLGSSLLVLGLCACTVGAPDYSRPDVPTPPTQFRGQTAQTSGTSIADLPWWAVFNDPALQSLITEGLANNQDIKVAVARIERARAIVGVAQSQGGPQLDYRLGAGAENTFVPRIDGADTVQVGSVAGALEAAWEFDVWGRIRHATEAAQANLLAQEEIRRGVTLTLVTDLAAGYFRLIELDRELVIAREASNVHGSTLDLFSRRFQGGRDSRLPVERAQASFDASDAKARDIERLIAQQENALAVLAGGYPRAIARGRPLLGQQTPATPVGATTDLMQRRPDVLEAEQRLIQANARIGEAMADKFPRIGLGALLGGLTAGVDGDWEGYSAWSLGLSALGPIVDGGRRDAVEAERRAHWDEAVAQYRKTVQGAFRETSDALVAQQTLVARRAALERQVAALRRSSDLAMTRYDAGRASYFEVLETQQQLFPVEYALAQTQRDQLLATVDLYKALGGGWNLAPEQWGAPQTAATASGDGASR